MATAELGSAQPDRRHRKPLHVLIVEDSAFDAELLVRQLRKGGYDVSALRVESAGEFADALASGDWGVILADYTIPGFGAIPALERLKQSGRDIPFIIVSGAITDEIAVASMRAGAHDYVLKNNIARLVPAIEREIREAATRRQKRETEAAVRYLSAIVESSNDAIVGKTLEGIITSWNRGAERLYGYTAAEMIGQSMSVLMPPDQPDEFTQILRRLSGGETIQMYDTRRRRKDGRLVDVALTVSPIRDSAGNHIGASSIARDITKRKRAEEAIERNARHTQRVLDNLTALVGVLSPDGTLLEVNKVALDLAGVAAYEVIGKPFWETGWWNYDSGVQAQLRDAIQRAAQGEVIRYDAAHPTPEGTLVTVDFSLAPLRDHQGQITHLVTSAIDITERKQAEEALRESKDRLRAVIENLAEGLIVVDPNGAVLDWNQTALRLHGYNDREEAPVLFTAAVDSFDLRRLDGTPVPVDQWPVLRLLRGEDVRDYELLIRRKPDGEERIFSYSGTLVRDTRHGPIGLLTIRDVTHFKKAQLALARSEKLASVGRMAATIAHEINNPLASAMNALFLASVSPSLDEVARKNFELAETELERVAHLTKQTLGFYRETGTPTGLDLPEIVNGVLDIYGPKLKNKSVSVERKFRSTARIQAIEGELRQVFSNLVANSIDAVNGSGVLHVRTSGPYPGDEMRAMVRLTVADTGTGISAENLKHVFEPFFTTKEAVGTGLGLWVTSELVKKHGGRIRVRSRLGKGTVFSIWVPAERRQQERETPRELKN